MAKQKSDAVFEGGGVKGIGLVGALQAFEEEGFYWENVAGASAGAIVAALVAAGYSAADLKKIMTTRVNFRDLMDLKGMGRVPGIGRWLNLVFTQGIYEGDRLVELMRELLAEKIGKERVTFADLKTAIQPGDSLEEYEEKYKYKLRVVASDISTNSMLILPQDLKRLGWNPDEMEVALAVRMSGSYPFFFKPVHLEERTEARLRHWVVDGGMLSNFPVWLFDSPVGKPPPWPTIGFLLAEPGSDGSQYQPIRGLVSMAMALLRTMTSAHDRKALESVDKQRIVRIPTGKVSTLDFDITPEEQEWLFQSGYQAAKQFLGGWSMQAYVAQRLSVEKGAE
jgi:NTE family protein